MNTVPLTLEALAARVTSLEKSIAENHESHGGIYARIEAVEKGHAVLDTSLTNIWTVLKEIQADVKDLKEKPGKRWDTILTEAIKWVVLGFLGAKIAFK